MFVDAETLALLTGLSVRKIKQLTRIGVIETVPASEMKEQTPEELKAELNELVSTEELAEYVNLTPRRILQYVQEGAIQGVKLEGKKGWYFYKVTALLEILKYIRERREDRAA